MRTSSDAAMHRWYATAGHSANWSHRKRHWYPPPAHLPRAESSNQGSSGQTAHRPAAPAVLAGPPAAASRGPARQRQARPAARPPRQGRPGRAWWPALAEYVLDVKPGDEAAHQPQNIGHIRPCLVGASQADAQRKPKHQNVHRWSCEEPQGPQYGTRRRLFKVEQPQAQDLLAPLPLFLEYLRERAHDPRFSQPIISEPLFYHCFAAITVPIRDCSTAG